MDDTIGISVRGVGTPERRAEIRMVGEADGRGDDMAERFDRAFAEIEHSVKIEVEAGVVAELPGGLEAVVVFIDQFVVLEIVVLLGIFQVPIFVVIQGIVPADVFEDLDRAGQFCCLLDPVVHVFQGLASEQAGIGGIDSVLCQNAVIEADGFVPFPFSCRFLAAERVELIHGQADGRQGDVECLGVGVVIGSGIERKVEFLGKIKRIGDVGRSGVGQVVVERVRIAAVGAVGVVYIS